MNNNFYEIPMDWYSELNGNIMPGFNIEAKKNMLTDPKNALDRGNLFNNLYEPYKNYQFRSLRPGNKQEELLFNILMHNFALTELDLYLDVNPNDGNMINLYNKYLTNKKGLVSDYEKNYGPLTLDSINMGSAWNWKKMPWPWEGTK